jgi:hypothetical protein
MKKRPVWKVIVFGIITLGIYDIYWLYKTRQEMVLKGQKVPRVILLFVPLFMILLSLIIQTVALQIFTGSTQDTSESLSASGVPAVFNYISVPLFIVGMIAFFVYPFFWFYSYSKAVSAVTYGATSTSLSYLMWVLLNFFTLTFVWPGIIQDGFNNIDDAFRRNDGPAGVAGGSGPVLHNPELARTSEHISGTAQPQTHEHEQSPDHPAQ